MADSDILCTDLAATSGVGSLALTWVVANPNTDGLTYTALDKVEVWAATTNNRGAAVQVGEGLFSFLHAGVPEEQKRWYWIRARNQAGSEGDWFPLSATGGVEGLSTTATIIRAGRVEGSEVIGSYFATSDAFPRVEIRSDLVQVRIFDEAGNRSAVLGPGDSYSDGLLELTSYGSSPAAIIAGSGTGSAASFSAAHNSAIYASNNDPSRAAIQAYNTAGNYAFFSLNGGYGPFTGAHDGLIHSDSSAEIGDVLVDVRIVARGGISDALAEVAVSEQAGERGVIGVLAARFPITPESTFAVDYIGDLTGFDRVVINALGEGQVNVCDAGGPIERGDLLVASPVAGKAMRQADDCVRASTVARAREAASFDQNGRAQIACIYLAG